MVHDDPAADYRLDRVLPGSERAGGVGFARQVMAADLITRGDGWERGLRCVQLQNDRLAIEIVIDRGIDIAGARIRQVPIAWRSPTDIVAPWYVENSGFGPHRSFFGGLLKTGGLDHFGLPSRVPVPEGSQTSGEYPMHGRISGAPARLEGYGIRQSGHELEAFVEGSVTQVAVFDEHLTLSRRISIAFGSSVIHIADTVTNHGFRDSKLAVLYHVNVGWPVVAPGASIGTPPRRMWGNDDFARVGVPGAHGQSKTWLFESGGGPGGKATAGIANREIDALQSAGLRLTWDAAALPTMVEWQMNLIGGNYVVALEPSTILPNSTPEHLRFPVIRPGEAVTLGVDIELLHGAAGQDLL